METIPRNSLELIHIDPLEDKCSNESLDIETIELSNHDYLENDCYNQFPDIEYMECVAKYEINSSSNSSYTSLKDLPIMSPGRKVSRNDIPIKDKLVQHAAWAYLYPMVETEDRGFRRKLKDKVCGLAGCLNEVLVVFKGWVVDGDQVEDHKEGEVEEHLSTSTQALDRRLLSSELDREIRLHFP